MRRSRDRTRARSRCTSRRPSTPERRSCGTPARAATPNSCRRGPRQLGLTLSRRTAQPPQRRARVRPGRGRASIAISSCRSSRRSCARASTRSRPPTRGALPTLVTRADIRGDLHMHSTWSDGRDTIEDMVAGRPAAWLRVRRDHRSLGARRWPRASCSRCEIPASARRSRRCARITGIEILHGIEVDIMHDGIARLRRRAARRIRHRPGVAARSRRPRRRAADRAVPARDAPSARQRHHASGEPIARPFSPGYDLDFDRLFAAARETGTAMEIDGAPGHLDMDGASPGGRGRGRHASRSTATAIGPTRSRGRCDSASAPHGAAGSSPVTC